MATLKLEGMERLQAALKRAPDVVRKHASTAVGLSAIQVSIRAKALAPEATGLLKRSIGWKHNDGDLTGFAGIDEKQAYYWFFVEFGTRNMSAQPFFRPAAEETQSFFISEVRNAGKDIEDEMAE